MVKVKICGITRVEDALKAVECGAWALGFIFYRKSPRYISPEDAAKIIEQLPESVDTVGVFVNEDADSIKEAVKTSNIKIVQLHGDEVPGICDQLKELKVIKAFRVKDSFDVSEVNEFNTFAYLFDAFNADQYGGTGEAFNWDILVNNKEEIKNSIILSGGLNKNNIIEAISVVKPFAVDVSSGVEDSPGIKKSSLIAEVFSLVNNFNSSNDLGD